MSPDLRGQLEALGMVVALSRKTGKLGPRVPVAARANLQRRLEAERVARASQGPEKAPGGPAEPEAPPRPASAPATAQLSIAQVGGGYAWLLVVKALKTFYSDGDRIDFGTAESWDEAEKQGLAAAARRHVEVYRSRPVGCAWAYHLGRRDGRLVERQRLLLDEGQRRESPPFERRASGEGKDERILRGDG